MRSTLGQCPYQSPTDMGVNMVGKCIVDDEACRIGDGVGQGADAQGDEHLVTVEPGILVAQTAGLQPADGLQDLGGDEVQLLVDAPQGLQRVQQQGRGGSQLIEPILRWCSATWTKTSTSAWGCT